MATTATEQDRPVTGERAPVLRVLNPATPMARMIRERLAERSAESETGEMVGGPRPEA